MGKNKITDALNSRRRQRAFIASRIHDGRQRNDDMSVAVIEKHPAERLTSLGAQRTSGLMTLGDRYPEIGADAFDGAYAASLSPLRCIQV